METNQTDINKIKDLITQLQSEVKIIEQKQSPELLKKQEKKRLQLSPEEIKRKEVMLKEEESKKESAENQLKELEDEDFLKIQKLKTELQLLEVKRQSKIIPKLEEDFKEAKYYKPIKNAINKVKEQILTADSNIKVLRRQINTKMC
jgi:hypothetical protein